MFVNSYAALGDAFCERSLPTAITAPRVLLWNAPLAEQLQLSDALQSDPVMQAAVFSGNQLLPGSEPIAMAYAGHQFGHFVPQLGDGRAHLLGEVIAADGQRRDVQLKGSGRSRFSRGGDGRCALGPAVREYIMSEAMAALGVATTRCLAVVAGDEQVMRNQLLPGAVVTRVAASHLRIGTFQYFAARDDLQSLQTLCDYALARHFPERMGDGVPALQLLEAVMDQQITLVVQWMRVGFIHGVMNTDNCTISGETIDYGPCAMMNRYDPMTVYSSIDTVGRYAFGRQSQMVQWNLARLAEALLPLLNPDRTLAIESAQRLISSFAGRFHQAYMHMLGQKFGLTAITSDDYPLLEGLLDQFEQQRWDYTNTFNRLRNALSDEADDALLTQELGAHYTRWRQRMTAQGAPLADAVALMQRSNPLVIARNHHVEAALKACEHGDVTAVNALLTVLRAPYEALASTAQYQDPPQDESNYQTFCGT
jgi:uncharacterized protein YdiU (UPF0061 family)